ncbi:Hsp20/alpha crystallin family protein [candidate division KSB1 bacterium]|nr:Hsp20/alpha crystallin family protein [candidate division KSB1 bacterium]RQW06325.1 MAG: Hsp20/alpha crystallin family protein [candidate division KSB1 bacterium]
MYYYMRPLRQVQDVQREMNRAFDSMQQNDNELECSGTWIPNVDVKETSEAIVLYAELPGLQKQDIKITIRDRVLSISGEKRQQEFGEETAHHRLERIYGNFCRQFTLPAQVDTTDVDAVFRDGVLALTLKKQEQARTKEIKIQA